MPGRWVWIRPGPTATASSAIRIPIPGTTRAFGRPASQHFVQIQLRKSGENERKFLQPFNVGLDAADGPTKSVVLDQCLIPFFFGFCDGRNQPIPELRVDLSVLRQSLAAYQFRLALFQFGIRFGE